MRKKHIGFVHTDNTEAAVIFISVEEKVIQWWLHLVGRIMITSKGEGKN